ncbi:MAG: 1-deoxy-D-xylulose-5-phosphate reductoisomerase [Gammaproteobacteria bacterium]|nr:1-deoxy-D-xylulose-5-phosphate reductoisomerase [Gammaproteobacteria bacterium]
MVGITILGSTGSIGKSTLDVLRLHPTSYEVIALTANGNGEELLLQCAEFQPRYAVLADQDAASTIQSRLSAESPNTELLTGAEALEFVAQLPEAEYVMAAIVGAAGLLPALAAARAGKRLLLANKEALVMSGSLFLEEARRHGAQILPIDSEHNAVFQCMPPGYAKGLSRVGVKRILLTASGGPFRTMPMEQLSGVTPEQACAHPNWAMGRKISVDSATMMNKGLEVIEACLLFNAAPDRVEVVLHPQSIIHSLVEYSDGSTLAQMGNPDMRTPIAHALAWPDRIESGVAGLDLFSVGRLDFEPPDEVRFPCLALAYRAIREGGTAPAVLNAANEVAVEAFLNARISFTAIPEIIESVMDQTPVTEALNLDQILDADQQARSMADQAIVNKNLMLGVSEA